MPEEAIAFVSEVRILKPPNSLKKYSKKKATMPADIQQLDFEFVLFASAVVDYDYIMGLIAKYTQNKPSKQKMTKEQLISLLSSSANLMDERDDIADYINSLEAGKALNENEISDSYQTFKAEKYAKELAAIANKHGLEITVCKIL